MGQAGGRGGGTGGPGARRPGGPPPRRPPSPAGRGPFGGPQRPSLAVGPMSDVTDDVLKGRLLVATPNLGDPNFERTVVLILEHGPEGALGVVLNRPSDLDLAEPLPEWARAAAHPPVVFIGGPVAPSAAVCL